MYLFISDIMHPVWQISKFIWLVFD